MINRLLAVRRKKENSGIGGAYPFLVGTIYFNIGDELLV
jgi:hypothetical protein